MVPAFSFLPLAFLILGLNQKNYKALDSLPFVYRDLINVLGLCRSWGGKTCYSELFTDSFAIAVYHQHRVHVCVWTALFRSHLAGAAHTGQPAG